jgi:2-polyprenyl-3-methyl-5-hydroxy-6-metoxy-1,4-benzoquinol methylase
MPPLSAATYDYQHDGTSHTHVYLWPEVFAALDHMTQRRVFDLGCGNGATDAALAARGWEVAGVDPSETGVTIANRSYPGLRLEQRASEDLVRRFGRFPAVLSLELIEHVYAPRRFAACIFELLDPGGNAVISTLYHGYVNNLALAASGQMGRLLYGAVGSRTHQFLVAKDAIHLTR